MKLPHSAPHGVTLNTFPDTKTTGTHSLYRYVIFLLAMTFAIVAGLTAFTYYRMMHTYNSLHHENKSLIMLTEAGSFYKDVRDLKKLATNHLFLGDTTYRQIYQQLYKHSLEKIARMQVVTSTNYLQKQKVDSLKHFHSQYISTINSALQLPYSTQISPQAQNSIREIDALLNIIEPFVYHIENYERAKLKETELSVKNREHRTMTVFVTTFVFTFLLAMLGFMMIRILIRRIETINTSLLESQQTFSKLFYDSPFMYTILKPGTTVIDIVNNRALEYLGVQINELRGKSIDDLHLLKSEIQKKQIKTAIMKGEALHNVEIPVDDAQGNTKWISFHSAEVMLNGKPTVLLGGIDITDRKVAEQKLQLLNEVLERRVEERTAELFDYKFALDEAAIVSITDTHGNIKYVNDNFVTITGYTRSEVLGENARILNSGYHTREFMQAMWKTITSGNTWRGEFCNKAKDGSLFWLDTTIIPFINESGKIYQYLAIHYDITKRKQAEKEILALNESLEKKVQERTQQLEEANRMLESFSYSVSHDLRAPLRNITAFAQVLQKIMSNEATKQQREILDQIQAGVQKMNLLIDELLKLALADKKTLTVDKLDMNILVQSVIKSLGDIIPQKTEIKIAALPTVMGDKILLQQVWTNLISNAVKYSSKKQTPIVEIWAERKGSEVLFHIKDNGAGFDMKASGKLFGVFQRLHSESEFEGTGVGLSIVKRIVQKHGGNITAFATPGQGAQFSFTLPS
jgi:PAS domain S-box-containing protein